MWLEVCLCSLSIWSSMCLRIFCIHRCNEFTKMFPLTLAYAVLCQLFLPTPHLRWAGILFFAGIQGYTMHRWTLGIVLFSLCLCAKEVYGTHRIQGESRIIAFISLGFFFCYFFFKLLGVDRDLMFVPLFFGFLFSLWIWAIWASREKGVLKYFVLGAMCTHVIEMALYLIPHPTLAPLTVHFGPFAYFLSPWVYMGFLGYKRTHRFRDFYLA